jgi:hypothetical protein
MEFKGDDFDVAEKIARRLGFKQTAYTSSSALWGLFCLPDRPTQNRGCIIKTKELGMLFVQDVEDMLLDPQSLKPAEVEVVRHEKPQSLPMFDGPGKKYEY